MRFLPFFSRDDQSRTGDPYVPNVVRYQLRYIPIAMISKCKDKYFSATNANNLALFTTCYNKSVNSKRRIPLLPFIKI